MLLAIGMRLISKRNNTRSTVIQAHYYFQKVVEDCFSLYGKSIYTMKLHSILHLVMTTFDMGPAGELSCKRGEDANGILRKNLFGNTKFLNLLISRFMGFANFSSMLSLLRDTAGKLMLHFGDNH